jgi:type I restriction enzyme S subunit
MSKNTKKLVPKLRFPEFRGAEEWNSEAFEDIYDFKVTNSFSRDMLNYENGSVKNIHYGDIHTKFSTLFDIENEKVPFINPSVSIDKIKQDCYCVEGDMVFADASEDLADVGKSIELVNLNGERLVSGLHTILARQKQKKFMLGFGGHLFKSQHIRKQIQKESQGAKVLGLSSGRLARIKVTYPSDKKEQQKIANCLSSIDDLIRAQSQKVEALKTHKKGLMQQLFPREGETVPRLRFPEFRDAGEWVTEELSKCLDRVIDYRGKAPPKSESGIPLITARNVRFGWLDMSSDEYIEASEYENWMSKGMPKDGDILFTTEAPLGNVALFPSSGKFALGQRIITLRAQPKKCLSAFLFHSLLSPGMQKDIDFHSTGSTAKGIKSKVFVAINFCHPSIDEQQKIADCLSSIDDLISAQSQKLESLKTHKKGLMQQLFPSTEADSK